MSAVIPVGPNERVLPTLNSDGTRRWLYPKLSQGNWWKRRAALAWFLIGLFTVLPHLRVGGKPAVLLDVYRRQFTFFGTTLLASETILLMLFLVSVFVSIFLITTVFGRVWCGWACPQTVYLEFVYRPVQRFFEGRDRELGRTPPVWRTALKYIAYSAISLTLAHTFLAWFVGTDALARWVTRSPAEHPIPFLIVAGVTLAMMLDFVYFREQICLVACPYGRFQSVLLDRRSLIVAYDKKRGEPRGKPAARNADLALAGAGGLTLPVGDCVDCGACVRTCPTGIDIRNGLQMECVHCTQCIDACDDIMDRLSRPRGLIRYSSRDALDGIKTGFLRFRTILYPLVITLAFSTFLGLLLTRAPAEVTVLRQIDNPFTVDAAAGIVTSPLRVKVQNRTNEPRRYTIAVPDAGVTFVAPVNPVIVPGLGGETVPMFVRAPTASFQNGRRSIVLRITGDDGFDKTIPYELLGPFAKPASPSSTGATP